MTDIDSLNDTDMDIITYLYNTSEGVHLYKISKDVRKKMPTVLYRLRKLERKGLVKSVDAKPKTRMDPTRLYSLTDLGEALGWAFLNTDAFVELYRRHVKITFA